jgi:D-arabinose 1-dehydrogenase-like Zn-dependent alcohol dehydrogenase
MKAQVLRAWDGPLALVDLPRPVPMAGEVLVAVRACGVGLTVLNAMRGQMARPETLPRVPGHEITGVVAEIGAGVTAVRPGDRVMAFFYLTCGRCEFCRAGRDSLCLDHRGYVGVHRDGGYAEFVTLPEANVLPLPERVSFVDGTAIPDAIATPYHVCATRARVRVGDRALVIGAAGGVGIHMIQMAHLCGARVTAVDVDDAKLARCREFGAQHTVNFDAPGAEAHARAALEGGATVAVDLVGNAQTLAWSFGLLGRGGRLVTLTTFADVGFQVVPRRMVVDELEVLGSRYCSRAEALAAARLVQDGRIRPVVSQAVSLEDVDTLHAMLRERRLFGRGAVMFAT